MMVANFLHFSDFHIPNNQGTLRATIDPFQRLDKLIKYAEKLELNPSFTIITGDLSDTGTTQSYKHVKKYITKIEKLGGPVFPVTGTRDNRTNFRKILPEKLSHTNKTRCYYSKTIKGVHVIALDSHTIGSKAGSLGKEQLDWLASELDENKDIPSMIALHEPILFMGTHGMFDKIDAARFREIISHGNVLGVLNGHLHYPSFAVLDGVKYVQAGSPLWINYFNDNGEAKTFDSSSFNVLTYVEEHPEDLFVRPVFYSEGQKLLKPVPRPDPEY